MTTRYCSPECQKMHWSSHKAICQNIVWLATTKQPVGSASLNESLTKDLRKFTLLHSTLLGWAGFQALQLKRMPANIRQQALLIELNRTNNCDTNHRFSIAGTHLVSRSYILARDPHVTADIQRREERCRRDGGIGTVVILIQCGSISQVIPVEMDPIKIAWDSRKDWAQVLHHFVESGCTDFKPISTPASIYYN